MLEKEIGRSKNLYTHTCISITYNISGIKKHSLSYMNNSIIMMIIIEHILIPIHILTKQYLFTNYLSVSAISGINKY